MYLDVAEPLYLYGDLLAVLSCVLVAVTFAVCIARELVARQNTDGSWASLPRAMQTGEVDGESLGSPTLANGALGISELW